MKKNRLIIQFAGMLLLVPAMISAQQQAEKNWDDPIFEYAKQMAQADEIVIGTPYWDLSFPAALKTYLEYCCVCDITFHYTNEGRPEGLCKSKTMTYITTSGGFIADKNYGYVGLLICSRSGKLDSLVQKG